MADPFTVLRMGNGFPFCVQEGSEPEPDPSIRRPPVIKDYTLAQMMNLYWNVKSIRINLDLEVTYEYWPNDSQPEDDPEIITSEFVIDETWTQVEAGDDPPEPVAEPKSRGCGLNTAGAFAIGPGNAGRNYSSGGVDVQLRIQAQIPFLNFQSTPNVYWRSGDSYKLYTNSGWQIWFSMGDKIGSSDSGGVQFFSNDGTVAIPNLRDTKLISNYPETANAYFWFQHGPGSGRPPTPFTRYVSHTWNTMEIEFGYHEY